MTNTTIDVLATRFPADPVLTPGEALVKLFLDNANRGANANNDTLVAELVARDRSDRGHSVIRRVVVTMDATMTTATVPTRPEAVEVARAMRVAAT
ncbi:MAG: hypothetical protein ACRDSR_21875 [Pseudonocardiaceae bacterium]